MSQTLKAKASKADQATFFLARANESLLRDSEFVDSIAKGLLEYFALNFGERFRRPHY
ncbi:Hypothetical predicted protein, partial [Pelobates cultripes]